MTATIKIVNALSPEALEKLGGEVEAIRTTIHFKLKDVTSFYITDEGDDKYLFTTIGGIEYPLLYEEILEAAFANHFKDEENSISA